MQTRELITVYPAKEAIDRVLGQMYAIDFSKVSLKNPLLEKKSKQFLRNTKQIPHIKEFAKLYFIDRKGMMYIARLFDTSYGKVRRAIRIYANILDCNHSDLFVERK